MQRLSSPAIFQALASVLLIPDPAVPARDLLLGPRSVEIFNEAFAAIGASCGDSRPTQVRYRPGSYATVAYRAGVQWRDGSETTETLVAHTGEVDGADHVSVDGSTVAVWRYPNDPLLPGLRSAADVHSVQSLLQSLNAPSAEISLRRRAYRPRRRAVIEASTPDSRIFLKVVRPSKVSEIQQTHHAAAGKVPVPYSHGWDADLGLVVIQALPGETLRNGVHRDSNSQPGGPALIELLDRLAGVTGVDRKVPGPLARVEHHVRLLTAVMPSLRSRLDDLAGRLAVEDKAPVVVHGDFHTSQVITSGGAIVGVIDLDTLGVGQRADDLAGMLGQLSTLAGASDADPFRRYGERLIRHFDQRTDPHGLRVRTAAAVLGFATGPFRVLQENWKEETERRIGLAERWADSAATG